MSGSLDMLYHGTNVGGIDLLEPKRPTKGDRPDEEPAVYATSDIDYASFMAVIGVNGWGGWNGKDFEGRGFYIYTKYLHEAKRAEGVVYFVEPNTFELKAGHEFKSKIPVTVIGSLAVSYFDLPDDLSVIRSRR